MAKVPIPRLVIREHARRPGDIPDSRWSSLGGDLSAGLIDRTVEHDVRMPSEAVQPHLSLMLLVDGRGHFLAGEDALPCEFVPGHCFLSCCWKPFDCEDFIPAHTHFRAVLLHFPSALREVVGQSVPTTHADCEIHAHSGGHAWLARIPMTPQTHLWARSLLEHGLPRTPLALLEMQSRALGELHAAFKLALTPALGETAKLPQPQPQPAARPSGMGMLAQTTPRFSGRDRRRLLEARRHIELQATEALSVAGIAAAVGLNETTLKLGFRHLFGLSVYNYVLDCRCRLASELLRTTELPVAEIAWRCGFANTSHLSKQFRRRFSGTPLQYRNAS